MKHVRQFCMILLFSFIGEFFRMVIPLPVPASVYGLVLLLAALLTGVIKLDQVEGAADFLIEIMPVMSNGRLAGIVNTKETNQEELLRLSAKYL